MPRIERDAVVTWEGNVARGNGALSAATSGTFTDLPYSLPSRISREQGRTSPEELLAAAHGGCITMSLATELTKAGTPPGRLETRVRIVMDEVEGQGHLIVGSQVEITAAVDGVDDAALQEQVAAADDGCSFSKLLRAAGADVQVTARLG